MAPSTTGDHQDDENIESLINSWNPTQQGLGRDFLSGELEIGEKADDAVDYADISDDDLPEEEEARGGVLRGDNEELDLLASLLGDPQPQAQDKSGQTQDTLLPESSNNIQDDDGDDEHDSLDDLFGDVPSSPLDQEQPTDYAQQAADSNATFSIAPESLLSHAPTTSAQSYCASHREPTTTVESLLVDVRSDPEEAEQHALLFPPAAPETSEELLHALWPSFNRDENPRFVEMLPPKNAYYVGKTPSRQPKQLQMNKVTLELPRDEEDAFLHRWSSAIPSRHELEMEQKGVIHILDPESGDDEIFQEADPMDLDGDEMIGNVSWKDIMVACQDWDRILEPASDPEAKTLSPSSSEDDDPFDILEDDWEKEYEERPLKRPKTHHNNSFSGSVATWHVPSFDDPEVATAKLARKVVLDLNDPQLLLDIQSQDYAPKKQPENALYGGSIVKKTATLSRYNISNDSAYDLLKENHQNKVRGTLGNLAVEHGMPALRLQYPYYKVKLARDEARSFHRPRMTFMPNATIRFSTPNILKRKRTKGQEATAIFRTAKDLSLADNSSALLLEYSEEYPSVLSGFGMGSRLINYYRRKNAEDNARPKLEIGETAVLMPQDRSPFSSFGHVDAGETVPTIQNGLFRAPVFKHDVMPSDFLVIRNTTSVDGSSWYMRNVDHLYAVGQQFPNIDVPGPHSRKVTTASKQRLRMIAYRKIRKNAQRRVGVSEITEHFPDSTDIQNRQKLKEFMQFNRDQKEWEMLPGESIPTEAAIQAMLKPDDVCLLEASQVGLQLLQDAGYSKVPEDTDADEGKEGQSLEQQLAPWNMTRNFLQAAQGKAMLQLHGEGDPSGRGEGFSFIRTSMKGGFKPIGESIAERIDASKLKELGGHSYNVARQQQAYEDSIRRIWEAQKSALSSTERSVDDIDDADQGVEADDLFDEGRTPVSDSFAGAAAGHHGVDDASHLSRLSAYSNQNEKALRIIREYRENGQVQRDVEIIRDPRVIGQYVRARHAMETENLSLSELAPTGDLEKDRRAQKRLQQELDRLKRNKDRTLARDKQKAAGAAVSPVSPASQGTAANPRPGGTQRKCANCGQVGHIKTNKRHV